MKFCWNVLHDQNRGLRFIEAAEYMIMTSYFQDGGHDAISCRKVLPSGKDKRSVCPASTAPAAAYSLHLNPGTTQKSCLREGMGRGWKLKRQEMGRGTGGYRKRRVDGIESSGG